jgi:hypothetical protein
VVRRLGSGLAGSRKHVCVLTLQITSQVSSTVAAVAGRCARSVIGERSGTVGARDVAERQIAAERGVTVEAVWAAERRDQWWADLVLARVCANAAAWLAGVSREECRS